MGLNEKGNMVPTSSDGCFLSLSDSYFKRLLWKLNEESVKILKILLNLMLDHLSFSKYNHLFLNLTCQNIKELPKIKQENDFLQSFRKSCHQWWHPAAFLAALFLPVFQCLSHSTYRHWSRTRANPYRNSFYQFNDFHQVNSLFF